MIGAASILGPGRPKQSRFGGFCSDGVTAGKVRGAGARHEAVSHGCDGIKTVRLNAPTPPAPTSAQEVRLDPAQRAALEGALDPEAAATLIVGAPGTGKTTVTVELVRTAVARGMDPAKILVIAATRRAAGDLRNVVAQSISGPVRGALVRTAAAVAFGILTAAAGRAGEPVPRLITGPEQDLLLSQILQGHMDLAVPSLKWPASIPPETLGLEGFRAELRDLFMRAAENGLSGTDLTALGAQYDRPEWGIAAQLLDEYEAITTLQTATPDAGKRFDPAQIVDDGAYALSTWDGADRPHWDLVVVDDYQEATAATARLLSVLARNGSRLVLLGDPDVAVQGFRGAMPALMGRATAGSPANIFMDSKRLGEFGATRLVLDTVWRGDAQLRAVTQAITGAVASVGQVAHRRAQIPAAAPGPGGSEVSDGSELTSNPECSSKPERSGGPETPRSPKTFAASKVSGVSEFSRGLDTSGEAESSTGAGSSSGLDSSAEVQASDSPACRVHVVPTVALQDYLVANILRTQALNHGRSWSDMAVICRSGGDIARMRRSLSFAGVPVQIVGADIALRDEPSVRPLLAAMRGAQVEPYLPTADGAEGTDAAVLEAHLETALELLTSPIGGLDTIGLRRLRRSLRSVELTAGGGRNSDALLVEALYTPEPDSQIKGEQGKALSRVARVLTAGREALGQTGATAQTVLWAVWEATGLAQIWQQTAIMGGPAGARADRDLDAVMSLFRAAENYVDRMPLAHPISFVDFIESQDLPADSLASGGQTDQVVSLLTPPGAAGRQWDTVIVAGVQDGTWPDLRLRDSLLGSQTLVELLTGRSDNAKGLGPEARKAVLFDELRAFAVATSRAQRQLIITAVDDGETLPSVFVDLVADLPGVDVTKADLNSPQAAAGEAPLTLRGLVSVLRAEQQAALMEADQERSQERARLLAFLARHGVPEADPHTWYGAAQVSGYGPLYAHDQEVAISPSRLEAVSTCALRWVLETTGGQPASGLSQSVGTLIHEIAAKFPAGSLDQLKGELDLRWDQLKLTPGWPSRRQKAHAQVMLGKLAAYFRKAASDGVTKVEVERDFTLKMGRAVLSGSADRLEFMDDGSVRIIDLKTGKTPPTNKDTETNPQLGAYQVAAQAGAFGPEATEVAGAQLLYIATSAKQAVTRNQAPLKDPDSNWAKDQIAQAVTVMSNDHFTAKINPMCQMCPVRRSCPLQAEGQQVMGTPVPIKISTELTPDTQAGEQNND